MSKYSSLSIHSKFLLPICKTMDKIEVDLSKIPGVVDLDGKIEA
jgi:hypothetical protein